MTWQALRIGLSAEVRPADRWKLAADAAYLPYVTYTWLDDHLDRNLQWINVGPGHRRADPGRAVLRRDRSAERRRRRTLLGHVVDFRPAANYPNGGSAGAES